MLEVKLSVRENRKFWHIINLFEVFFKFNLFSSVASGKTKPPPVKGSGFVFIPCEPNRGTEERMRNPPNPPHNQVP